MDARVTLVGMVMVPATCDKCGTMFPSGIDIGGGTAVLTGNRSGPCPRCGSMGTVRDGFYEVRDGARLVVSSPTESLRRINATLDDLRSARIDYGVAMSQLSAEGPAGERIAQGIGARRDSRMELWTFIMMLATLVMLVLMMRSYPDTPEGEGDDLPGVVVIGDGANTSDIDMDAIIEQVVDECSGKSVLPAE